ncbi:MAG: DUF971 domain-containing protein [Myxococcales bacterium]
MGLWDHMRPVAKAPEPSSIEQAASGLVVSWDDSVRTELSFRELRLSCPCAGCVEEWSGKRTVDPAAIPEGIHPLSIEPVGNYALSITWSDGHSTGIYSWSTLRALGRPT